MFESEAVAAESADQIVLTSNQQILKNIAFRFDGYAVPSAFAERLSDPVSISLLSDSGSPINVRFTPPSGCRIGVAEIKDRDLSFLAAGQRYGKNDNLRMQSKESIAVQLVIRAEGGYGRASGPVSCAREGFLSALP